VLLLLPPLLLLLPCPTLLWRHDRTLLPTSLLPLSLPWLLLPLLLLSSWHSLHSM
jgi:hypothetical protein